MAKKRTADDAFDKLAFFQALNYESTSSLLATSPTSVHPQVISASPSEFPSRSGSEDMSRSGMIQKSRSALRKSATPISATPRHNRSFPARAILRSETPDSSVNRASQQATAMDLDGSDAESHENGAASDSSSKIEVEPQEDKWGDQNFPLEKILTHRWFPEEDIVKYLVKWEGEQWDLHLDSTWEPEGHFPEKSILNEYYAGLREVLRGRRRPFNLVEWERVRLERSGEQADWYGQYEEIQDWQVGNEEDGYRWAEDPDGEAEEVSGSAGRTKGSRRTRGRRELSPAAQRKRNERDKQRILMERADQPAEVYRLQHEEEKRKKNEETRRRKIEETQSQKQLSSEAANGNGNGLTTLSRKKGRAKPSSSTAMSTRTTSKPSAATIRLARERERAAAQSRRIQALKASRAEAAAAAARNPLRTAGAAATGAKKGAPKRKVHVFGQFRGGDVAPDFSGKRLTTERQKARAKKDIDHWAEVEMAKNLAAEERNGGRGTGRRRKTADGEDGGLFGGGGDTVVQSIER